MNADVSKWRNQLELNEHFAANRLSARLVQFGRPI